MIKIIISTVITVLAYKDFTQVAAVHEIKLKQQMPENQLVQVKSIWALI